MADEKLNDLSILDTIVFILNENKEPMSIYELIEKAAKAKSLDIEDVDLMTQLYMDITLSGNFVFVGDDKWTLKDGNLEFWDKDGFEFVKSDGSDEAFEDEVDFTQFNYDDIKDLEADLIDEDNEEDEIDLDVDLDEDDEDDEDEELDEETKEEKAYVDVGLDLVSTDEDDGDDIELDLDDDYDEDDYNEIMDDYEDMYDN